MLDEGRVNEEVLAVLLDVLEADLVGLAVVVVPFVVFIPIAAAFTLVIIFALLLVTLLGVGVMGFILFTKIQAAGGRKKRDIRDRWTELLPELETLDLIILNGEGES